MKLNILGYSYVLDVSKNLEEMDGNVGYCNFDRKELQVANDVDTDVRRSTIIHEIIEALNYHLGIGLQESQVKQLEVGLHQVLSENGVDLSPIDLARSDRIFCTCKIFIPSAFSTAPVCRNCDKPPRY